MKFTASGQGISPHWPLKLWRIMKLTAWLVIAALPISAKSFSQQVTINEKNCRLANIFEHIKQQTGISFMADKNLLDNAKLVSINEKNAPLDKVLAKCLEGQQLQYAISNKVIVVTKLPENHAPTVLQPAAPAAFTVSGTVQDDKGRPLPGASILITREGYKKGIIADEKGAFLLSNVPEGDYTLEVSLLGFTKYTSHLLVNNASKPLQIRLSLTNQSLNEMVVVAYGSQKKTSLTGAISSISSREFENRPVTNVTNALEGTMSGVTVRQSNGQPGKDAGTVRIRGIGTLNNSEPMVVIDGLISSMNDVNPNDIASVSVLKDASSAAMYGSRAANGVVLITTKKGKRGKMQVAYDAYVGKQKATRLPEFLPSWQQASLYNEGLRNEGAAPRWTDKDIQQFKDGSDKTGAHPNTDWLGLLYRGSGLQHNHYLSVNGGDEKAQYMLSLGYFDQDGIIKGTNNKKYTTRINLNFNLSKRVSLFANLGYQYTPFTEPVSTYPGVNTLSLITFVANQVSSTVPYKYANGYYGYGPNGNPIASLEQGSFNNTRNHIISGNVGTDIELAKGLHFKPSFGYRLNFGQREQFVKDLQFYDYVTGNPTRYDGPNNLTNSSNSTTYTNLQATLEYEKRLGLHHFTVLGGASQEFTSYRESGLTRRNFLNNLITEINAGPQTDQTNSGMSKEVALRSFFGRLNYDYNEKYLLEASLRYDGSSRFAASNRWGLFPSFSGGWNIAREDFFEPARDLVSELKLRGSWGRLGNQDVVGNYPAIFAVDPGQDYSFNQTLAPGVAPINGANPNITWESTTTTDLGIDAALFRNKLTINAGYFIRNTNDILMQLPIGAPYSLKAPYQNAAAVRNKGWEFSLGYNGSIHKLHYSVNANATFIKNAITDLKGAGPIIDGATFKQVGYPIDGFYGYIAEGLFQTAEQVNKHARQTGGVIAPGDVMYKDLNSDGKIDGNDRTYLGSYFPKMTLGFNLHADWNGFDIGAFFQGALGVKNYVSGNMLGGLGNNNQKPTTIFLDRWTPENTGASFPRLWLTYKNNTQTSSFWVRNASYLRLKNLQFGYQLPNAWVHRLGLQRVKFYYSGQNLLTFTQFYNWVDPEAPQGERGYTYPQVKIHTFGLNVTF